MKTTIYNITVTVSVTSATNSFWQDNCKYSGIVWIIAHFNPNIITVQMLHVFYYLCYYKTMLYVYINKYFIYFVVLTTKIIYS